jgi:hypothetical protein
MIDIETWVRLAAPFPAEDIEWRIAERGKKSNGEQWAKVLAYVTNRAIMQRLDTVVGPAKWRNEFQHLDGAFLCGIAIKIDDEWVMKWDGAQESQIEATKGGISGAMKRAAVQWGIGRYLYNLEAGWANISAGGKNYAGKDQKKNLDPMKWDPPVLPAWALPTNCNPPVNAQSAKAKSVDTTAEERAHYKTVMSEIDGAMYPVDVDNILSNRAAWISTMPDAGRAAINKAAKSRREALGGA